MDALKHAPYSSNIDDRRPTTMEGLLEALGLSATSPYTHGGDPNKPTIIEQNPWLEDELTIEQLANPMGRDAGLYDIPRKK